MKQATITITPTSNIKDSAVIDNTKVETRTYTRDAKVFSFFRSGEGTRLATLSDVSIHDDVIVEDGIHYKILSMVSKTIEKVIRGDKVAVIICPEFGGGFYTGCRKYIELLFHPKLVALVESGQINELSEEWVEANLGLKNVHCADGVNKLEIKWLPIGTRFYIETVDGRERIVTQEDLALTA